jgi:hypothetical protein
MKVLRKISRRSFLASIGGGAAAAGALLTLSGCATLGSDSDPYDPIGGGSGGRGRRGRGDDGRGRGGRGRGGGGGCSDNDSGRNADPSGRGRCR